MPPGRGENVPRSPLSGSLPICYPSKRTQLAPGLPDGSVYDCKEDPRVILRLILPERRSLRLEWHRQKAKFDLHAAEYLKVGMRAKVIPEAPIGGQYTAEVKIVDKVIDAASGTFGVRLELPNPNYRLPAGLKCKVIFP